MAILPTFTVLPLAGSADRITDPSASQFATLGLENLIRASGRVLCGSEPRGKSAFKTLKKLGVNTIVSVDGAAPQVVLAKQVGIRYIHIPIGYDGVSKEAGQSLTRAVQETDGAIYVHCHHGHHRGPAAAAIACRIEGTADADHGDRRHQPGLRRTLARRSDVCRAGCRRTISATGGGRAVGINGGRNGANKSKTR
ncbi:MAG: dual specificity protein phosphatase family protein [Fuerstiella sp.]|nr:dual specificity protein phosphatase family protein [Fuerstiella sp.]